ncbi:uncharacterized protein CcaverHIS019_0702090 [Cutaneotrichosporon cavernicola]|uniref:Uncharacterized protein n=1 Tax=Cutaneotrichosporon cavernicola TaxID=279322 RepID=A0AA48QYK4_9TREE|nr:uncharacterized protein CcaverHIS019_0702090 [Cutaneotrichosporon cavernicola]BEI94637.1 hypothetical protein CcaverHIS019_0702090 [Cutaneotrichosporon cavernicola]BEJ02414.1 hypothetical protein CcaverHIS631_0702090 [Cutaneotrichosporon cavernicola]BEJ10172.1 hypothetical protein CcaverHIS641_0702070 [Cutaneotrichosporon cavernicola]
MASRILVRGLHTTRAVLDGAAAVPAKTSLGFKAQPKRTRTLPTLKIAATAQQALPSNDVPGDRPRGDRPRGDRPRGDRPRGDRPSGDRPNADRAERPRNDRPRIDRPRTDRPRTDRPRTDRPRTDRPRGDSPANVKPAPEREPQQRVASLDAVSAEFFEGAEHAATPARKFTRSDAPRRDGAAPPRKKRESKGRGKPELGDGSRPGEGTRAARSSNFTRRTPRMHAPIQEMRLEPVKRDTSSVSLFGTSPLIVSALARSRDPLSSVWAKGMERSDASRADMLRAAGDYSLLTPARPEGKGTKLTASTAICAIGMNPSISMRRRGAGEEVIRSYLS